MSTCPCICSLLSCMTMRPGHCRCSFAKCALCCGSPVWTGVTPSFPLSSLTWERGLFSPYLRAALLQDTIKHVFKRGSHCSGIWEAMWILLGLSAFVWLWKSYNWRTVTMISFPTVVGTFPSPRHPYLHTVFSHLQQLIYKIKNRIHPKTKKSSANSFSFFFF